MIVLKWHAVERCFVNGLEAQYSSCDAHLSLPTSAGAVFWTKELKLEKDTLSTTSRKRV